MKIEAVVWEKVHITYKEKIPRRGIDQETLENVSVYFNAEDRSLSLRWQVGDQNPLLLLARANVLSIKPWEILFEASWWSAKVERKEYDRLIPATIRCTL